MSGQLRIGLTPGMNMLIAVPLIERFHKRFPQVKLSVLELVSDHLEEWLVSDRLDIGVLFHPIRVRTLQAERIGKEPMSLISPGPGRGAKSSRPIEFAELSGLRLVLPSRAHSTRVTIENAARQAGCTLQVMFEVDSIYAVKQLVANGDCSTIYPEYLVRREIEEGLMHARQIVRPTLTRVTLLATSHSRPVPSIRELRSEIISVIRETHIRE